MAFIGPNEIDTIIAAIEDSCPAMGEPLCDALGLIEKAKADRADPALIEAAREAYGSEDIEIDDMAGASPGEGGTWVQAWVWIADEDDGECKTCAGSIETRLLPCDECGALDESDDEDEED